MKKQGTNMKNFKRILAMLLVFMMSYSSVFAEFVPPAGSPVKEEVIEGTHLKYSLYVEPGEDEFIYTIYVSKAENAPENGNFSIPDDYTFYSKNLVKELYIEEGITGIGARTAANMTLLEKVHIPSTVTYIGDNAFVDNGRMKIDGGTALDLSNVTSLGAGAFSGCAGIKSVVLNSGLTKIPDNVFRNSGITSVNLPGGVTEIGGGAFYGCQIGTLTFPDTLTKIGADAFYGNRALLEVLIPENVTAIGANAFYANTNLQVVDIRSEKLQTIDNGAFGTDYYNAYSRWETVEGERLRRGADFRVPNENIFQMLKNEINCYLGEVSPMTLQKEESLEPTCLEKGKYVYLYQFHGKEEKYTQEVPVLEHEWEEKGEYPATCEEGAYKLFSCSRNQREGDPQVEPHTERRNPETEAVIPEGNYGIGKLGHDYQFKEIVNPVIGENGEQTQVVYECSRNEGGLHNNPDNLKIIGYVDSKVIETDTTTKIKDLTPQLPKPKNADGEPTDSQLTWQEGLDQEQTVSIHEDSLPVTYITGKWSEVELGQKHELAIRIHVNKTKLDFTKVSFLNWQRWVGMTNEAFQVQGLPMYNEQPALTQVKTEFKNDRGGDWTQTPPGETEADKGNYTVRITYQYDPDVYEFDENSQPVWTGGRVKLAVSEATDDTVYLTGPYWVAQQDMTNVQAQPIANLVYNGAGQNTLRLSGVPSNSKITMTWTDLEGIEQQLVIPDSGTTGNFGTLPLKEAGEYPVHVLIEKHPYANFKADVTVKIAKQPVAIPKGNDYEYTPGMTQTGVVESSELWVVDIADGYTNSETNAGPYTAKLTLNDPANYCWKGLDDSEASANVNWKITKRAVLLPSIVYPGGTPYTGEPIEGLRDPQFGDTFTYVYEDDTYVGYYDRDKKYKVFTATNAKETNAGEYTVTLQLAEPQNYYWQDKGNSDVFNLGSWKITKQKLAKPTVTVNPAEFTGAPYDESNITVTIPEILKDIVRISGFQYYQTNSGAETIEQPVKAGGYYVGVVYDYDRTNYELQGENTRYGLLISKKSVTMERQQKTVPYNGQPQAVPEPMITGLIERLEGGLNDYTLTYTYDPTPDNGDDSDKVVQNTPPEFTDKGEYKVSVSLEAENYQAAEAVECTLTIEAGTQGIQFSTEDTSWNPETKTITKTYGDEKFIVKAEPTLDKNAAITYSIAAENQFYATIEGTSGLVTLLKAKEAGIPVTATAAETNNVASAADSYKLIINKAPTAVVLEKHSVPYDGQAVTAEDFAKATVSREQGQEEPDNSQIRYTFYANLENAQLGQNPLESYPSEVGTYGLRAYYPGSENYKDSFAAAEFTIEPAELIVEKDALTETYAGTPFALKDGITSVKDAQTQTDIPSYTVTFIKKQEGDTTADQVSDERWQQEKIESVTNVADSGDYFYKIEAANYGSAFGELKATISPKELTLSSEIVKEKTYDGTDAAQVTSTVLPDGSGAVAGEITDIKAEALFDTPEAGNGKQITVTYTLTFAKESGFANYGFKGMPLETSIVTDTVSEGKINKVGLRIKIPQQSKVYDGTDSFLLSGDPEITNSENIVSGETVTPEFAPGSTANTDGKKDANEDSGITYPFASIANTVITLAGASAQNYEVTEIVCPDGALISKKTIALAFGDVDTTYNGAPYEIGAKKMSAADGDLVSPDTIESIFPSITMEYKGRTEDDGQYTEEAKKEQGEYTARATLNHTNYKAEPAVKDFAILPAAVKVDHITPHSGIYDGQLYAPATMKVTDINGNDVTSQATIVFIRKAAEEASAPAADDARWTNDAVAEVSKVADSGEYWYKVSYPNHSDSMSEAPVTVSISPKDITFNRTLTDSKEYNGTTEAAVVLNANTVDGTVNGEVIQVVARAEYDSKDAGENKKITISYSLSSEADLANYSFGGSRISEVTATRAEVSEAVENGKITTKALTVTVTGIAGREYDATDRVDLGGAQYVLDGLIGTETLGCTVREGVKGVLDNANAGENKPVTITPDQIALSDGENGGISANYTVTTVTANPVTIARRQPTLTLDSELLSMVYNGRPAQKGVDYRAIVSGLAGEDNLDENVHYHFYNDINCSGEPIGDPINVGVYGYKAVLDETTNYFGTSVQGQFEILSADGLNVQISGYSGTYDGKDHSAAAEIKVLAGDDPIPEYRITYAKTPEDAAEGRYEIAEPLIKEAADSGTWYYKVTTQNYGSKEGQFEAVIARKDLEITHDEITRAYNGEKGAEIKGSSISTGIRTADGAMADETISVTAVTAEYDIPDVSDARAVTANYSLAAGADTNLNNYSFHTALADTADGQTGTVTLQETGKITPANLTVTLCPQESVYDGQAKTASSEQGTDWKTEDPIYSQDGVSDELGIVLSIPENSKNAGSYPISGTAANGNYHVIFNNEASLYTIKPRSLSLQIGNGGGVYGDDPDLSLVAVTDISDPNVSDSGLVAGDSASDLGIILKTDAAAGQPVSDASTVYKIYAEQNGAEVVTAVYGNYEVTFTNGAYTIAKRPIIVTILDHESDYLAPIAEGITNPKENEDYTLAYTDDSGKSALFAGEILRVTLTSGASAVPSEPNSAAGTYPIAAETTVFRSAENMTNNYEITVLGETPFDGELAEATYTINKAKLHIKFASGDQDSNGIAVSYQPTYDNPLILTNESTGAPVGIVAADLAGIVQSMKENNVYVSDNEEVVSNSGDIAIQNDASAVLTLNGTGVLKISVSVPATANYEASNETWFILHVAHQGSGIQIEVEPVANLAYTGELQKLVTCRVISPDNAMVQFSLTGAEEDWQDAIPTGTDAGVYRVYYKASANGYSDATGYRDVRIYKAANSAVFTTDTVNIAYEEHLVFDGANLNPLILLPDDYTGKDKIEYRSNTPSVAWAEEGKDQIKINGVGQAKITATLPADDNYSAKTVSYILNVGTSGTEIVYTAADPKATYNGQPHRLDIMVTGPSEYTIYYKDENGDYTLTEAPVFTNRGTYPVEFKITANGFTDVEGSGTVTISPKEIEKSMFENSIDGRYTYIGSPICPPVTVSYNGMSLEENVDFTVEYGENLNAVDGLEDGSVTVTAIEGGNYTGSATVCFDIAPIGSNYMTAALDRYYGEYGDPETDHATVTVMFGTEVLTNGVDYTISCEEKGDACTIEGDLVTFGTVGPHTIEVTGLGNHQGSVIELEFTLLPATTDNGLSIAIEGDPAPKFTKYGDLINAALEVTADGAALTEGTDYALTYEYISNTDTVEDIPAGTAFTGVDLIREAGLYIVTATAMGSYQGSGTFVFCVEKRDLADVLADAVENVIYSGEAFEPVPENIGYMGENGAELTASDYVLSWRNNVNAAASDSPIAPQVVISAADGSNNFIGSKIITFTILPKSISEFMIDTIPDQLYTGASITPAVTVRDENGNPLSAADCLVEYTNNTNIGTADVTVTGRGNYTDTTAAQFNIIASDTGLKLEIEKTEWTYDGAANAGNISVLYGKNPIAIGTDCLIRIAKDGGEPTDFIDVAAAAAAMIEPGKYTVAAIGLGGYANTAAAEKTVTISKIKPAVTLEASPESLTGSGKSVITVTVENLPDNALPTKLSVTKNGEVQENATLTKVSEGVYSAEISFNNENATYVYSFSFAGDEHYEPASDSVKVVTARRTTVSSGGSGGGSITVYTVTFDSCGGSNVPVQKVARGLLVTAPQNPEKEGYVFAGWFTDPDCTVEYNFDTKVAKSFTLYAGWLEEGAVTHKSFLSGYEDGSFRPEGNITRAEAAMIFFRLMDVDGTVSVQFVDVPQDAWYAEAVGALAEEGIIIGRDETHFAPDEMITRAEFVTICTRFDTYSETETINDFTDVEASHWAYAFINYAVHEKWIEGYDDGLFRPDNFITRAEAVCVTGRVLKRSADKDYIDAHADEMKKFTDVSDGYWAFYEIMEGAVRHNCYVGSDGEFWYKTE